MKTILKTLTVFSIYCLGFLFAVPNNGEVSFTFNNQSYTIHNGYCVITERNSKIQIGCGVSDKLQRIEFLFKVKLDSFKNEVYLDLDSNDITVIFKQYKAEGFTLYPSVHYISAKEHTSSHKHRREKAKKPGWMSMSHEERKHSGRGIVRVAALKDSKFFLHIKPIFEAGKLVKLQGDFSGLVGRAARSVQRKRGSVIKEGRFTLEVQR